MNIGSLARLDPRAVRVAVIVPTFSADRLVTLRKCLDGILSNTRRPDEIVIVVDRNLSLFQLLEHEHRDSDIVVALSEGSGVSAARNTGADMCRSDILVFLDDLRDIARSGISCGVSHPGSSVVVGSNGERPVT